MSSQIHWENKSMRFCGLIGLTNETDRLHREFRPGELRDAIQSSRRRDEMSWYYHNLWGCATKGLIWRGVTGVSRKIAIDDYVRTCRVRCVGRIGNSPASKETKWSTMGNASTI